MKINDWTFFELDCHLLGVAYVVVAFVHAASVRACTQSGADVFGGHGKTIGDDFARKIVKSEHKK